MLQDRFATFSGSLHLFPLLAVSCGNKTADGRLMYLRTGLRIAGLARRTRAVTCVLGDVVQQQRVLGESLHLDRDDVFQLQPATQTVAFGRLQDDKKGKVNV